MRGINHSDDFGWSNAPRKGGGGGGGTNTVVQQSGPPAQVLANYQQVYGQAQNVAQQPFPTYDGSLIAGFTPQQIAGFNNINTAVNAAQPFLNTASQDITNSTTPLAPTVQPYVDQATGIYSGIAGGLTPSQINQYESPYTSQVVNATENQLNNQNAIQQAGVAGNAISQGAFGGDREAVAQAITAGQQQLNEAPTIAGLENTGYAQAIQTAEQQQQLGLGAAQGILGAGNTVLGANQANAWLNSQAGFGMANLGNEAETLGLTGANAELSAGAQQQQQAQSELNLPYQEFLSAQGYPYQVTNFLQNAATGTGSLSGTQGSTTSPGPSALSQIAGTGLAGAGLLGETGAFGANGWLTGAGGLLGSGAAAGVSDAATAALGAGVATDLATAGVGADVASMIPAAFFAKRGGRIEDVMRSLRGIHIPRRRDDGGSVNPALTASFGGNPLTSNLFSMYAKLPTEKLQELSARSPGNPLLARAIQMRRMSPQSDPSMQPPQQAPVAGMSAPSQMQSSPGGFANGGWVHRDDGGSLMDYDTLFQDPTPTLAGLAPSALPNEDAVNPPPALGGGAGPMPDVGAGIPVAGFSMPPLARAAAPRDTGEPLPPPAPAPSDASAPAGQDQTAGFGDASSAHTRGPWDTLLAAGLGILGGTSPHAGVNIGQGGLKGLEFSEQQKLREEQQQFNNLYRQGLLGVRGQQLGIQQQRANTADRSVDVRQQIADRAAQLRQQGMDNNQANAQARLDIARSNSEASATYKGVRLGQIDESQKLREDALSQGAQRIAQSKEANDARLALTRAGQDRTSANADVSAASRMVASGAVKDFPTALKQVQAGRSSGAAPTVAPTEAPAGPPSAAVDYLKAHPELAPQFKQKYGVDPQQYLGQ